MGSCLSLNQDPEARQDRDIQNEIGRDQKKDNKVKKILFLGSGGSGKSTIFKQLRQIYGEPMTRVERRHYVQYIHEQCITQMKHALDMLNDFQEETNLSHDVVTQNYNRYAQDSKRNENEDYGIPDLSDQGMEYADYVQSLHHTKYRLNDEIVNALKELWKEPAIKKMYDLRNITGIEDSSEYFWNILDTIADPNYIPDLADTLLVRKRTTGTLLPSVHCVTEAKYEMKDRPGGQTKGIFNIVDVGGQKSERRKWVNCFDSVTAVIFVASLSCYDEVLFEDMKSNTMTDQLQLFDDIINNQSLSKTSMILFLNKRDLFAEKIKRVPLSKCKSFATYRGDADSFDQTTRYIRKAFCSLNQNPTQRNIFTHITCATDTDNVQRVFADVQHIVIEASLIQAGLMDWDDERKYQDITGQGNEAVNSEDCDPATANAIRAAIQKQQDYKTRREADYDNVGISTLALHARSVSANNFDFRERIKRDSIPHIRSIEYLSVLPQYEYSDDRNVARFTNAESLLKGKYSWAVSTVPPNIFPTKETVSKSSSSAGNLSVTSSSSASNEEKKEMYLMVDIAPDPENAGRNVQRRRMNLAVVLDVGQSMNRTYTDTTQKLEQCKRVIVDILKNKLNDDDRFCLIYFDDINRVFEPMVEVGKRNIAELSQLILNKIRAKTHSLNSTRVDHAGFHAAIEEFRKLGTKNKEALLECENRVIVMSALPLSGKTIDQMAQVAEAPEMEKRVYSTFICNRNKGDVNWDKVQNQRERVYQIAGCNYFTINSSEQLKDRLVARFEETVTPLMFDLSVTVEVPSSNEECVASVCRLNVEQSEIEKQQRMLAGAGAGAGAGPEDEDMVKNEILSIRTLFPETAEWTEEDSSNFRYNYRNHHYLLLVQLKREVSGQREFKIVQRYCNENGEEMTVSDTITLEMSRTPEDAEFQGSPSAEPFLNGAAQSVDKDYYDNMSIRKAIVLSRYIRMLRDWVQNDNDRKKSQTKLAASNSRRAGSIVSAEYQSRFEQFASYFQDEAKLIRDDELTSDLNVLKLLFNRK